MDSDNEVLLLAWTFGDFVPAYALYYVFVMRILC